MSERPVNRRTYGSKQTRTASSSSLGVDNTSSWLSEPSSSSSQAWRSSSPPSSSLLETPPLSSPPHNREVADDDEEEDDDPPLFPEIKPGLLAVQSTLKGFFTRAPKRKRPLAPATTTLVPSHLSNETHLKQSSAARPLQQMHLTHLPLLHTCKECQMSYVRGSEDGALHLKHHARVIRGIPWDGIGRGGKSRGKGGARGGGEWCKVVAEGVSIGKDGRSRGRVVECDGSWGGPKLDDILATVNTVLSSPPLPPSILNACKVLLFVTSSPPPLAGKRARPSDMARTERIDRVVGVVVSQGIKWAMRVLQEGEDADGQKVVDSGGGVICDPTPLSTPLGIHRLFTVPSYRSLGIAQTLLDVALKHTVYACEFDPAKGEVAFSQPTESGRAVMERWGGGQVRVFVDDESQL